MSEHQESICHTLPEHKTWLRTGEVACYLDINKSSVFCLSQKGKIPARCFGYSVRILRADILAFENGAGIRPAITRMVTNKGKKKPPELVWGAGGVPAGQSLISGAI